MHNLAQYPTFTLAKRSSLHSCLEEPRWRDIQFKFQEQVQDKPKVVDDLGQLAVVLSTSKQHTYTSANS